MFKRIPKDFKDRLTENVSIEYSPKIKAENEIIVMDKYRELLFSCTDGPPSAGCKAGRTERAFSLLK